MKRCVIVGGAPITDYNLIRGYLKEDDFFVFCDSGLKHMQPLGVKASLIVGDFDSHANPHLDAETIVLPTEKDDTDTVFAIKEAVARGFGDFLLIGVIGKRIDHTLGNIYALLMLDSLGKKAKLIDDYSEMEIISRKAAFVEDKYPFFSLIAINGNASGITVENAKYPLQNAEIKSGYQYGVSNEVIKGETASITVENGELLLVKIIKE